ncbi:hypothetical protein ACVCIC_01290 [Burkholderia glumae]
MIVNHEAHFGKKKCEIVNVFEVGRLLLQLSDKAMSQSQEGDNLSLYETGMLDSSRCGKPSRIRPHFEDFGVPGATFPMAERYADVQLRHASGAGGFPVFEECGWR